MSMMHDLDKVVAVIQSCTNTRHNNVAFNMVQNFEKKWKHSPLVECLFELCDQNMSDMLYNNRRDDVMTDIKVNGRSVVMSLEFKTEPGEGWIGTEYIGVYYNLDDLNEAIHLHKDNVPVGWMLHVEFQNAD